MIEGDEAKAGTILKGEELKAVFEDTLTKGQASALIDRLVRAGIRPKPKRQK